MKTFRREFWVPIYLAQVTLNISDNIIKEIVHLWPKEAANLDYSRSVHAYHLCDDNKSFWLFFEHGQIDHGNIAHEIGHLALHILGQSGVKTTKKKHEPLTYLLGHLHMEVYRLLIKNKIRITLI